MTTLPTPAARAVFLIVDDEPLARLELGELLGHCGYDHAEAANTAEALALLEADADRFAGLITDINMPGTRSGVVLANHVRYIWPHINIIVISAHHRLRDGELPAQVSYLAKPVAADALLAAIATFEVGAADQSPNPPGADPDDRHHA